MSQTVKRSTKQSGELSEAAVLHALVRAGFHVSIPFGENQRYDLVAEKEGVLSRVQVKTGRLRKGAIRFNSHSSHAHRNGGSRSYFGEIEFFAVYCPETDDVFLVPVGDAPSRRGYIRHEAAKNGQRKKIRSAEQFLLSARVAAGS